MSMIIKEKKIVTGYPLIIGYLGVMMMIVGVITLLPLLTLFFYPQDSYQAKCFILPSIVAITIGYLLFFNIRGKEKGKLHRNQDAIIVVACWSIAIFFGAMPFVLSGDYNFTQGVFEATSGWSTTGLSIVDVAATSHLFLMHRSTILFFGGIGLVLVMLSVLSDTYGMRLYNAEGHSDRLLPNLLKSTRIIMTIYTCYILAGIVLYVLYGMSVFDAIIHSIGAVSTGGFSSKAESIAYYDSIPIETITIILMLLGNINFLAHLFLVKGKFKNFFHYCEIKLSIVVLAIITPIIAFLFMSQFSMAFPESLRISIFQAVSALTTTGFQTIPSFHNLSSSLLILMIILQLIGGGIGSTAGGIKQYRICILCKGLYWNIRTRLYPRNVIYSNKIHKVDSYEVVSKQELADVGIYVFIYMSVFFLGTFVLTCYGYSVQDSMFDFSSALGTVGLSTGIMNSAAPSVVLWTGTLGMFLGRLEIYVIILALLRFGKDMRIATHHIKKQKNLL